MSFINVRKALMGILKTKDIQDALQYVNSILEYSDLPSEIKNLETLRDLCQQSLDLRTLSWVTTDNGIKQLKYIISGNDFCDVFGRVFKKESKFVGHLSLFIPSKDSNSHEIEAETENLAMEFVEAQAIAHGNVIRR
jgi:chemotaxis regulatin CheY-phosphate phosphatase CheZ